MITFYLNKHQWEIFAALMKKVAWYYPVEDYELETCLIAEFYKQRLHGFTYFTGNKDGLMKWSIPFSAAFAINLFFTNTGSAYNGHLRQFIEPKLPSGKSINGLL